MKHPGNINIEDYTYTLPPDRIAWYPLLDRDSSKLLVYKNGHLSSSVFNEIHELLPTGSLLLLNETKVIQARLHFSKPSGSIIEIFCLEPVFPSPDFQVTFAARGECTWNCLVGNSRRWKGGALESVYPIEGKTVRLKAERLSKDEATSSVRFSWEPGEFTFSRILETFGIIPLPPYIKRESEDTDRETYQTVYAKSEGSVAAPTAGLHFTDGVLAELEKKSISKISFTLHVGAGTFRPVETKALSGHEMHREKVWMPLSSIQSLYNLAGKPKIVVGTTTTRLVESLYWQGVKWSVAEPPDAELDISQWEPYSELAGHRLPLEKSLETVLEVMEKHGIDTLQGSTSLIIAPGYEYAVTDIMITNFHQPRSTLLLLIAAFIGEDWRRAYKYALENGFRFLSYGDSCLFFKA